MFASQQELFAVLRQYNPWWGGNRIPDVPKWHRAAFAELHSWVSDAPAPRAVLVSGARQVGKTTLFLQTIESLLASGVPPERILYATFDHPLLKLLGLEGLLKLWQEMHPATEGIEYLFLDEVQFVPHWQTWLKHQVDFEKRRRIAVTGSAVPLSTEAVESGLGRWHTIRLATLSFFEYLQIKNVSEPGLPPVSSLTQLFEWTAPERIRAGEMARPLVAHFHEYLLRGGFPQTALVESIPMAQRLLREDIVERALKRDMTATFGVRRILELEKMFLYLCLHDGGILDMASLCKNLEMKKETVNRYIDHLEAAHLIYRLVPFGYGKEVLRGRPKIYLADAAISGSVLLRGRALLEDSTRLGAAVETAFFKHVFTRYYQRTSVGFSYWRGKRDYEVDIVAQIGDMIIPFEVKYREGRAGMEDLKGLGLLCQEKHIPRGYVVTRDVEDFDVVTIPGKPHAVAESQSEVRILRIPAPLACYWLSKAEVA